MKLFQTNANSNDDSLEEELYHAFEPKNQSNSDNGKFLSESDHINKVKYNDYFESCNYCLNNESKALAKCLDCDRHFCNGVVETYGSHLVLHLINKKHKRVQLHTKSALGNITLECINCGNKNVFGIGFAPYPSANSHDLAMFCREYSCLGADHIADNELNPKQWESLISDKAFSEKLLKKTELTATGLIHNPPIKSIFDFEKAIDSGQKVTMKDVLLKHVRTIRLPRVKLQWENIGQYSDTFETLIYTELLENEKFYDCLIFQKVNLKWDNSEKGKRSADFEVSLTEQVSAKTLKGFDVLLNEPETGVLVASLVISSVSETERISAVLKKEHVKIDESKKYDLQIKPKLVNFKRMSEGLEKLVTAPQQHLTKELFQILLGSIYEIKNSEQSNVKVDRKLLENIPGLSKLNPSQIAALEKAIKSNFSILQGPPGTGKSVSCTALAYYFAKHQKGKGVLSKNQKILVCAPSNNVVDHLTSYLIQTGLKVMQVCSRQREELENPIGEHFVHNRMKTELEKPEHQKLKTLIEKRKNQLLDSNQIGMAFHKEMELAGKLLNDVEVITTTCINSFDPRLNALSFPIVIIDEATQAIEPEVILTMLKKTHKVILAGDHMQLGPTVMSKDAARCGLNQSLFLRMVKLGMAPLRLEVQYRMHPELSLFSSDTFYDGVLQNGVSSMDRHDFALDFPWPSLDKPLFFWHVVGKEEISPSGTSFYNRDEADLVGALVQGFHKAGLASNKLGIITPYKGQLFFLKKSLVHAGEAQKDFFQSLEINSIDAYQGREKDYIVISTVRSSNKTGIGFLNDEKRLNVALTRARFGLIIVGNALSLAKNNFWKSMLYQLSSKRLIYEGTSLENLRPTLLTFERPDNFTPFDKSKLIQEMDFKQINSLIFN
jgi:regulator of nonsense transcripts 1